MGLFYALLPFLVFAVGVESVPRQPSCSDKCKFDAKCKTTQYIQYSPCSYACVCDNQYTYYEDPDFKQCGTEKRCYQGQCIDEVYNRCDRDYGDHFIGLLNQGNPCSYICYDSHEPCNIYEEYFPDGVRCYTSHTLGQCIEGHCITRKTWITNKEVYREVDGSGVIVTETENIDGTGERAGTAAAGVSVQLSKSGKKVAGTGEIAGTAAAGVSVDLSKSGKKVAGTKEIAGTAAAGVSVDLSKSGKKVAETGEITGTAAAGVSVDLSKSGKKVAGTGEIAGTAAAEVSVDLSKSGTKVAGTGERAGTAAAGVSVELSKSGKKVAGTAAALASVSERPGETTKSDRAG